MGRRLLLGISGIGVIAAAAYLYPREQARVLPTISPDATIALYAAWEPCRSSRYGMFQDVEVLCTLQAAEPSHSYRGADLAPLLPSAPVDVGETWPLEAGAVLPFLRQFHGGVTYTPGQFEGRLRLEGGRAVALSIALPDRDPNVDTNVPDEVDGQSIIRADIGYVPRMELSGGSFEPHSWTRSIPDAQARELLASRFYPFKSVEWLPFDRAVARARELGKPLHLVVLFGAFDDESC